MKHSWTDPHMIKAAHRLLDALKITAGVFVGLFVLVHLAGSLYTSSVGQKSVSALRNGLDQDLAYLSGQIEQIAGDELLLEELRSGDAEALLGLILRERDARSLETLAVTDARGVVISRTLSLGVRGDNIFMTTPEGRSVAMGEAVKNIGIGVVDPSTLRMTAAMPILDNGAMIGGIFSSYFLDDDYAVRFRDQRLPHGVEVIFYTKEYGIYGNSFSDPESRKLVDSYFSTGSEWIQNGESDRLITLRGRDFYVVENVIFGNMASSSGGALLLVPRPDFSGAANILTTFLVLLCFVILAARAHMRSRSDERGVRYYVLLLLFTLPIIALIPLALRVNSLSYLKLDRVPFTLYNSTLRFQPEFGIYDLGFEQRFSVVVDTGEEAINAIDIGIRFDPKAVAIKSLEPSQETCSYTLENVVDDAEGLAKLTCLMLKPSGERGSMVVAHVVAMPLRTGTFELSFDKEQTRVLAADGLGTDVLRMSQASSYRVDEFDPNLFADGPASDNRPFIVFSPTHPNQSRWYNGETARFLWRGKPDAVYKYAFDSVPDTVPSDMHTTQGFSVDVAIPGDGIFYFHLGTTLSEHVAHYKIRSDRTPPNITSVKLSEDRVVAGDVVRMSFGAEDVSSGVQKNFYVDLGNRLFLPVGSELYVPFLEAGEQKVLLRVYDDAGNYSENTSVVSVDRPGN